MYPTWESVTDGEALRSSGEEGVRIMEGIVGGAPLAIATVNMANHGCIPGLPDAMVVEAPAVADGTGLHLQQMEPLPTGITAMLTLQGQINALLIEAYVERSRRKLLQALLIDPTVAKLQQCGGVDRRDVRGAEGDFAAASLVRGDRRTIIE